MHFIRLCFVPLAMVFLLANGTALANQPDTGSTVALPKSGLVVIAYPSKGLTIAEPGPSLEQEWIRMHWMSGLGGVAPWVADAFWSDGKRGKQRKAMRDALADFDHDRFDQRVLQIIRCQIPADRVQSEAPVREWQYFGSSSARNLGSFTPGSVLVLQANVGFNPQLDELRFRIEELHVRFSHRAKSLSELKRLPKAEAEEHRPDVTVVNVHEYRYRIGAGGVDYSIVNGKDSLEAQFADGHGPSPTELRITNTLSVEPDRYGYNQMGAIWAADQSALLREQVELGLQVLEASMRRAGGLGCNRDASVP